MASRKKLKVVIKSIFIALILGILILTGHYLYYESTRLKTCGVDVFNDWKSYIAYLLSKIPYVKDRIEYTPLKISDPVERYDYIMEGYLKDISEKIDEIKKEEALIENQKKALEIEKKIVEEMKNQVKEKLLELERQKNEYFESLNKIKDFAELLRASDPEEISNVLNQDSVSPKTIASALSYLPKDLSAEILQSLSRVNPKKAADVVKEMAAVEDILKGIEAKQKELETRLKNLAEERAEFLNAKVLGEILSEYFNSLSAERVVQIIEDLDVNVDVLSFVIRSLTPDKRKPILDALSRLDPELFKELLESGVKY